MPRTTINGGTDIRDATITAQKFVASLNLPTAQLQDGALFLKSDGTVSLTAALNAGTQKITNLAAGSNPGDAVNFAQLAAVANGYGTKGGADTASLTNQGALSGLLTINGVTLTDGDVVFLYAQTTGSQNGPWVAHAGAWTRPAWYTGTLVTEGAFLVIERGTYAGYSFILTTQGAITVDTTATSWQIVPTATTYTNGNGINITGNSIAVKNGNGVTFDGSQNVTLALNGASLNLSASGIKVSDAAAGGQVLLGGAANAATWTGLGGDVASVSSAGVVALTAAVRKTANFITNEQLSGAANGVNATFTLANAPAAGTVALYLDGMHLFPGATNDYTISGATVTMVTIPQTGDRLTADYQI